MTLPPFMHPPDSWSLFAPRRALPFPPGVDGEEFEVAIDVELGQGLRRFHISTSSGAVYAERSDGRWDRPPWDELPDLVRHRVWEISRAARFDANADNELA